ncbi:MAG TPA: hypothetical protein VNM91_05245 [Dehalococcoidia bacterium]|nr:hypothetical protein [Dehalococcoidia bacterium]
MLPYRGAAAVQHGRIADERSFAAWVQPIAAQLAADRREVVASARWTAPDAFGDGRRLV